MTRRSGILVKLLVFDVDGTLTATNRVDGHSFLSAVRAVLPISADLKWSQFPEVTASGILRELWATHSTEEYDVVEAAVKRHFFGHIESAVASDPEAFLPIRGAVNIFAKVREAGWTPPIATGGWRRSAEPTCDSSGGKGLSSHRASARRRGYRNWSILNILRMILVSRAPSVLRK